MSNEPRTAVSVPAGRYVLGDPCYSISNEKWNEWLDAAGIDLVDRHPDHILAAEFNGHIAFGVSTAHGDGTYEDQYGNAFDVDAGLIGLVHIDSADYAAVPNALVIEITEDIVVGVLSPEGVIEIGDHQIETDPNECNECGERVGVGVGLCDYCEEEQDRLADACPGCEFGADGELCDDCIEEEEND